MKKTFLMTIFNMLIFTHSYSQSTLCNSTGEYYKNKKFQIDTVFLQYPKMQISNVEVLHVLEDLFGYFCIKNKAKKEMPYYGLIKLGFKEENKIEFIITNDYTQLRDTFTIFESYKNAGIKIIGCIAYQNMFFYLLDMQNSKFDYSDLFKITDEEMISETYVVKNKRKNNLWPAINKFCYGTMEFNFSNGKFILNKKDWVSTNEF